MKAAEPIIDFLFKTVLIEGSDHEGTTFYYRGWSLEDLFKDYAELIIQSALGFSSKQNYQTHHYTWTEYASNDAVDKLCGIKTAIASNILHKIANRAEKKVISWSAFAQPAQYVVLNLDQQKAKAKKELEMRGNPVYNPSIYLEQEVWKLK